MNQNGVSGRPECRGRVVQPPKPQTYLPERIVGAQPIRPWRSLAQGLAGQERQALATLLIEAAGSRGALEADVFQMPQHRVHGRRPRLRGAADFVAAAYGSETAPAGQPSFGHPSVLPRSDVHGDRISGSVGVGAVEPAYVDHPRGDAERRLTAYRADLAHRATKHRARRRRQAAPRGPQPPPQAHGRDAAAVREYEETFTTVLMASGLPKMMSRVLTCLYTTDAGSLTASKLVQRLQVSPASISKAITFLESQGLVRRERDERRRERCILDDDVWYQAMIASDRSNAQVVETARQLADARAALRHGAPHNGRSPPPTGLA